jgi:hypothetical protein
MTVSLVRRMMIGKGEEIGSGSETACSRFDRRDFPGVAWIELRKVNESPKTPGDIASFACVQSVQNCRTLECTIALPGTHRLIMRFGPGCCNAIELLHMYVAANTVYFYHFRSVKEQLWDDCHWSLLASKVGQFTDSWHRGYPHNYKVCLPCMYMYAIIC